MIDHLALSIGSAGAGTGVHTLLLDTGHGQRTLRAEETFRPAVGRNSYEAWQAGTGLVTIDFSTLSIGSAG